MKIFIIGGKARQGKDTVCGMIRKYYSEKDIKSINLQFSSYIKEYAKKISGWDGDDTDKPRELLQELGSEVIRDKIDPLFFVKRMIGDIKVYSHYFDIITISDARFKVEIDTIKENFAGVIAIKIERPNFDNGLTEEEKKHSTEVDLDDYDSFDYEIINDGSIEDLNNKINELMKVIKWI